MYHKGHLVLAASSPWTTKLIEEFHVGALKTYKSLAASLCWWGMLKQVCNYVANCLICRRNKYDTLSPAGLLHPLQIPNQFWEDLNMDFLFGLPRSKGIDCIFVVVDCLSNCTHFLGLRYPFTAKTVAQLFVREIIRLRGSPYPFLGTATRCSQFFFGGKFLKVWVVH